MSADMVPLVEEIFDHLTERLRGRSTSEQRDLIRDLINRLHIVIGDLDAELAEDADQLTADDILDGADDEDNFSYEY